jgi:hypothetical protein
MTQMTHAQKNVVYNTEDNIKVTFVVDEYDTPYYITVKGPSLSAAGVIIQTSHDRGKDENWNTYDDYRYCIYKEDDVNYLPDNDMTTPFNDDSSTCVTIRYVTINNVIKDRYITVTQGNNTLTSKVKHMSFKMTTNKKHNTK